MAPSVSPDLTRFLQLLVTVRKSYAHRKFFSLWRNSDVGGLPGTAESCRALQPTCPFGGSSHLLSLPYSRVDPVQHLFFRSAGIESICIKARRLPRLGPVMRCSLLGIKRMEPARCIGVLRSS